jgi:uncharacterized protein with NAD-binding domain and iron-sulfur cluster
MVDNVNPTNQFHPYQPPTDTPVAERQASGLNGILSKAKNLDLNGSLGKVREYAKSNPGMVLGGLAAAAIGLGMMRRAR